MIFINSTFIILKEQHTLLYLLIPIKLHFDHSNRYNARRIILTSDSQVIFLLLQSNSHVFSEIESKDCKYCKDCDKQHYCLHCQLSCAISSNCQYCKIGIEDCIATGFCGKVCGIKGLPNKQPLHGKDC